MASAYSLAATLGFVVAIKGIGTSSPGVMIAAFVPMILIAIAYRHLNNADPDRGTSFAWVTRALGPHLGWLNGWTIFIADVVVMASLADIAAVYTYQLFGWSYGVNHISIVIAGSVLWIVLMTWICWRGIELSARLQQALLSYELIMLLIFSVVAFAKVASSHPAGSMPFQISWLNPFAGGFGPMVEGVLLAVFIYWGWDSGVSVNEETENSRSAPGAAAVISTLLLLVISVVVSSGAQSYAGTKFLVANPNDVLTPLGKGVLGSVGYRFLIVAILTSASTQTTILPTARTTLSMARWRGPRDRRPHPPPLHDADVLDSRDGRHLDRVDDPHPRVQPQRRRARRRDHRARLHDRVLLRMHRHRLCRLLPQAADAQPQGPRARRRAAACGLAHVARHLRQGVP
ncbi:MAG TPA: APC family permease [Solirubrobacteraceae bacterium]|nr:APC family permease [Solirubrobacteraceae bacterium]